MEARVEVAAILDRLTQSVADATLYADGLEDERQRFASAAAALIDLNRARLADAIAGGDEAVIAWAVRSVAGMTKGIIDQGGDWIEARPAEWAYLWHTIQLASAMPTTARSG